MPKNTQLVALTNLHGPDADLVPAGHPIPDEWPDDHVEALVASGGAGSPEDWGETELYAAHKAAGVGVFAEEG